MKSDRSFSVWAGGESRITWRKGLILERTETPRVQRGRAIDAAPSPGVSHYLPTFYEKLS